VLDSDSMIITATHVWKCHGNCQLSIITIMGGRDQVRPRESCPSTPTNPLSSTSREALLQIASTSALTYIPLTSRSELYIYRAMQKEEGHLLVCEVPAKYQVWRSTPVAVVCVTTKAYWEQSAVYSILCCQLSNCQSPRELAGFLDVLDDPNYRVPESLQICTIRPSHQTGGLSKLRRH
jgi:hypothetical protein